MLSAQLTVALAAALRVASAQSSCSASLTASYPAPSVKSGYSAQLVANQLESPRSIKFDSDGRLLVVQQGLGIQALTFEEENGCFRETSREDVVRDEALNHGLELSQDGRTLYASTQDEAYSWAYNPDDHSVSSKRTLVDGMRNSGHETRTLYLSTHVDNQLIISRGSAGNEDLGTADLDSGRSQIKVFDLGRLQDSSPYDYTQDGRVLGWGLRNSVGVTEHPVTGGIYSVENSVDNMMRLGVDIHNDNPAEEMNFHGYLNGTQTSEQGQNYGYPACYTAWDVAEIPQNDGLETGTQFAIGDQNSTDVNDENCKNNRIAPRLSFPAHWAPLDIKFNSEGNTAYITSRGSWNREDPHGYKVFAVEFDAATGDPTEPRNSQNAAIPILSNVDESKCPDDCFRPVGLAWDKDGRLFMSSDSTGEIYMIAQAGGENEGISGGTASAPSAPSGTPEKPSAASSTKASWFATVVAMGVAYAMV